MHISLLYCFRNFGNSLPLICWRGKKERKENWENKIEGKLFLWPFLALIKKLDYLPYRWRILSCFKYFRGRTTLAATRILVFRLNNCRQVLIGQQRIWIEPDKMSVHLLTYSVFILILLFSFTCYGKWSILFSQWFIQYERIYTCFTRNSFGSRGTKRIIKRQRPVPATCEICYVLSLLALLCHS